LNVVGGFCPADNLVNVLSVSFKRIEDVAFQLCLGFLFLVSEIAPFCVFVENEPLPSSHCILYIAFSPSVEHWFYFLLIAFHVLPDLFECHEDSGFQFFEIDPSALVDDQLSSLFYLLFHVVFVFV
jgi:hypothetical protein